MLFAAAALPACGGGTDFHCDTDYFCFIKGAQGVCVQSVRWCGFPDGECASGLRYWNDEDGSFYSSGKCVPSEMYWHTT